MKFKSLQQPSWLVSPAASMTMAYGGVIACWFIFLACTSMLPTIFQEGPYYLISTGNYWAFTAANVGLGLWLLVSIHRARRAGPGSRRGLLAGIAISLGFLAALQLGAQALHTDLNRENRMAPEVIAAVIQENAGEGQDAVAHLRNALHASYPDLKEAASRDSLHYKHDGQFSHSLMLSPSSLRLEFYGCSAPVPEADGEPWSFERPAEDRLVMNIPLPLSEEQLRQLQEGARDLPRVDPLRR